MRIVLELQGQPANIRRVTVRHDIVIGRGSDCNLRLSAPQVSRRHCFLRVSRDTASVTDLESSNGTFLGGTRLKSGTKYDLVDGDELALGPVLFLVRVQSETLTTDHPDMRTGVEITVADSVITEPAAGLRVSDESDRIRANAETRKPESGRIPPVTMSLSIEQGGPASEEHDSTADMSPDPDRGIRFSDQGIPQEQFRPRTGSGMRPNSGARPDSGRASEGMSPDPTPPASIKPSRSGAAVVEIIEPEDAVVILDAPEIHDAVELVNEPDVVDAEVVEYEAVAEIADEIIDQVEIVEVDVDEVEVVEDVEILDNCDVCSSLGEFVDDELETGPLTEVEVIEEVADVEIVDEEKVVDGDNEPGSNWFAQTTDAGSEPDDDLDNFLRNLSKNQ